MSPMAASRESRCPGRKAQLVGRTPAIPPPCPCAKCAPCAPRLQRSTAVLSRWSERTGMERLVRHEAENRPPFLAGREDSNPRLLVLETRLLVPFLALISQIRTRWESSWESQPRFPLLRPSCICPVSARARSWVAGGGWGPHDRPQAQECARPELHHCDRRPPAAAQTEAQRRAGIQH